MKTENNTKKVRLFVALPVPGEILRSLVNLQSALRNRGFKASWSRLETLHLTLNFLGEIPVHGVEKLAGAMEKAVEKHGRLSLGARGLGVFPTVKRARVVWAGVSGDVEELFDLQRSLAGCLSEVGIPVDRKSYSPHFTLARIKGRAEPREMIQMIREFQGWESPSVTLGEVNLYKSDLKPSGAVHTLLRRVELRQIDCERL